MENELSSLFQYSRDAVLCVKDNRVLFANSSAAELFGRDLTGEIASKYVPAHLLGESAESFVSCADIFGRPCTVSAALWQDALLLTFQPERPERRSADFVSESLVASMTAALCNVGLTADLLSGSISGKAGEKERGYISMFYHSYYTLKRLIGNLSTALSLDTGTLAFLPRSVDMARLCSDLVSTAALMLNGKAKLSFSTACGELIANVDPDLIERMLLNLIQNSCQHIQPDGEIRLGLQSRGGKAIISVDDTGSGIPPHRLQKVFRGYELPYGPDYTGAPCGGLGLSICRGIAEIHNGSIIIESRAGRGTSVRIMLPAKGESFAEPSPPRIPSMDIMLTELSGILGSGDYVKNLMD